MLFSEDKWTNVFYGCAAVATFALVILSLRHDLGITGAYFRHQDAVAGIPVVLTWLALAYRRPETATSAPRVPTSREVMAMGVGLVLLLWVGTYLVMWNYPVSRDELMANFDADILGRGLWAQPVSVEWREFIPALVPNFLRYVPGNVALISAYLPGNAGLRAGVALVADIALCGPVLTAVGLIALHRIARGLFPESSGAVWVCLLTYLLSSQVLVNGMSSYAMPAHLTFNLVWLALFREDKAVAHLAAIGVGAYAIGLHQYAFHPLFAAAFIATLAWNRRWGWFAAYGLGYVLAIWAWTTVPLWTLSTHQEVLAHTSTMAVEHPNVLVQILATVKAYAAFEPVLLFYNLTRFLVWMPVFTLPLALLAWPDIRRGTPLARPLLASIVATAFVVMAVMPYQGHGWGYRYVHGLIGNIALLSGFGFQHWSASQPGRARMATAAMTATSLLLVTPWLLYSSNRFVKPLVEASARIDALDVDFVIIDTDPPQGWMDQVRNNATLTNRPLVFAGTALTPELALTLCARGSVGMITREQMQVDTFFLASAAPKSLYADIVAALEGKSCLVK